jgi:hypothetical protein
MGFGWACKDKKGTDLFKEFDPTRSFYNLLDLGPNSNTDTDAPYSVSDMRSGFLEHEKFMNEYEGAARAAIESVQEMARANKNSLNHSHCGTCTCCSTEPVGWSVESIDRFLSIPLDRVWRCSGGF